MTIPDYIADRGHLLLVTDRDNFGDEGNEENNILAVTYTLEDKADLVISTITVPESVERSETIPVSWTVINQGSLDTKTDWFDYVYLSADEVLDSSDRQLAYHQVTLSTGLATGESYTVNLDITLPPTNGPNNICCSRQIGRTFKKQATKRITFGVAFLLTFNQPDFGNYRHHGSANCSYRRCI